MAAASKCLALALAAALASCAGAQKEVIAADPARDEASALLARAEQELAGGQPARAAALFEQAAALRPTADAPLLGVARARLAAADVPAALAAADRALARRESPEGRALRGRALARQRQWETARIDLERALAGAPGDSTSWALLAAVQVNRGDRVEASFAYGQAVALLTPADAANAAWRELRFLPPDPVQPEESLDRCTRGCIALLEGQPVEALREASNGLRFAPQFAWCSAVAAEASWRTNDAAQAERLLRSAIRQYGVAQEPLRADAKGLLAELLSARKETAAEAAGLARDALTARGERVTLLVALGRACEAIGDVPCAREAAARILKLPHLSGTLRTQAEERVR